MPDPHRLDKAAKWSMLAWVPVDVQGGCWITQAPDSKPGCWIHSPTPRSQGLSLDSKLQILDRGVLVLNPNLGPQPFLWSSSLVDKYGAKL